MNMIAAKTILLDDCTVFLLEGNSQDILAAVENAKPDDINIILTKYGFDLKIKTITLPIEERMIEHIARTGVLVIMSALPQEYLMSPVYKITVPHELIYETRGALNYSRIVV